MDRTKSRRVMSLRSAVAMVLRTLLPPGFRLLDVRSIIKCLLRNCGTACRFCNSERVCARAKQRITPLQNSCPVLVSAAFIKQSMTDDAQLFRRYAEEGSEQAFGELVARYINLVYSAAVRQTGDAHLAEDVAQAVFTALARKARALPREVRLGGWLYRHACFVAAQTARTERRRQARERRSLEMNGLNDHSEPDWEQLAPFLDEAMKHLGTTERDAILLRYFENRGLHDVGNALGVSEDAARKRVTRAVEKLRTFFMRRGLTLSTATLATLLAGHAVVAAPTGLAVSVTSAALAGAATSAGISLTLLKVMTMTKLKAGIASAIVVAGLATPLVFQEQTNRRLRSEIEVLREQT